MLVVLPLGSYLYLTQGIDYRLAAMAKVEPKGELLDFEYYQNGLKHDKQSLLDKTVLIHIDQSKNNDKYIDMIADQFAESPNLELIQISTDSNAVAGEGFINVYSPDFSALEQAYKGKDIILIDTGLQVRSYYDLSDSTLNELVRDIAVVLPLKKKSTIKMTDR